MQAPSLVTPRLLLRPWRDADKAPFAALNADPEVMAHFPAPLSRDASNAMVARIRSLFAVQGWGFWAVEVPGQDGAGFIGFVGLHRPEGLPCSPCTEVGWRLARPFWGQGYATEAARACLAFAFTELREEAVVAFTATTNQRSLAVMHRLGMTEAGGFEHPALPPGHPLRPHALWRISHSQFARVAGVHSGLPLRYKTRGCAPGPARGE